MEELKRNIGELVADFIKVFNKFYHNIPCDYKPPVSVAKFIFSKSLDDDFKIMLRERTSITLEYMKTNAIEVESNRSTSVKLRAKEKKAKRKMKAKEEGSSSKSTKEDKNIDEITSLLTNISNRILKMKAQPITIQ